MAKRSSLVVALIIVAFVGVGVGVAQLGLRNDGVEFPDGTVQTSAAETPGEFVQGSASVVIQHLNECAEGNVFSVPAGKRLRVEWISIELSEFAGDDFDPVDIDIRTWLNGAQANHFLPRIDGSIVVGTSFFRTVRWSSPITLYNQGNRAVSIRACRDNDTDETGVDVRFHGQLFNE